MPGSAEVGTLERIVSSQYVWAILFLLVLVGAVHFLQWHLKNVKLDAERRETALINLYEQQRTDSKAREENLMTHLDKTTKSLEGIEKNLTGLEQKLNASLNDIWRHIDSRRT